MKITVDDVVREVRKLATEQPDFVYTKQEGVPERVGGSCSYLAAMDKLSFEMIQEYGEFPEDLTFEEARQLGMLGNRCIVGQALSKLGVSDETLLDFEGMGADYTVGSIVEPSVKRNFCKLLWLNYVQDYQDRGYFWGDAVNAADRESTL